MSVVDDIHQRVVALASSGVLAGSQQHSQDDRELSEHPFDTRDVHPDLPLKVRQLFDDGHYSEATFAACKYLDSFVGKHAPDTKSGERRMLAAFSETSPIIALTDLASDSEMDEQRGYRFLFAGTMIAIRNPRGHDDGRVDDPFTCLDHLGLISALLRRLNQAGFGPNGKRRP